MANVMSTVVLLLIAYRHCGVGDTPQQALTVWMMHSGYIKTRYVRCMLRGVDAV